MSECTLVFRIQRYDMHVVFNHYCALNILVASFWLYVYNIILLFNVPIVIHIVQHDMNNVLISTMLMYTMCVW